MWAGLCVTEGTCGHDAAHASAQVSLDAEDIRNEKVKVLRSMRALSMDDVVIGQYRSRKTKHAKLPGYLDDKTVPSGRCGAAALPLCWPMGCTAC